MVIYNKNDVQVTYQALFKQFLFKYCSDVGDKYLLCITGG